jgi:hypothetical protein
MKATLVLLVCLGCTASSAWGQAPAGLPRRVPDTPEDFPPRPPRVPRPRDPRFLERRNQLTLDLSWIGGTLGFARRVRGERLFLGAEVGLLGDYLNVMLLSGGHFAQDWGLAYDEKDGATGKHLLEIVHAAFFLRHQSSERWQLDFGARASVFLHSDSSDDDPGEATFAGLYGSLMYGSERFKVGPRVMAGLFSEGRRTQEFGLLLVPLTARVTFAW